MTLDVFTFRFLIFIFVISEPRNRFTRYPSWNNKMYPIWKDGDPRYKDSWKGIRWNIVDKTWDCLSDSDSRERLYWQTTKIPSDSQIYVFNLKNIFGDTQVYSSCPLLSVFCFQVEKWLSMWTTIHRLWPQPKLLSPWTCSSHTTRRCSPTETLFGPKTAQSTVTHTQIYTGQCTQYVLPW